MERWLPIPGHENYEVSDLGSVRLVATGAKLRPFPVWKGYLGLNLCMPGKRKARRRVHQLVALAFLGPPPAGLEVDHKDGVKANCALSNLEYVTPLENRRRARELGLVGYSGNPGEKHPRAKLTEAQAQEILAAPSAVTHRTLAARFGLKPDTVAAMRQGRSWKHLPRAPARR